MTFNYSWRKSNTLGKRAIPLKPQSKVGRLVTSMFDQINNQIVESDRERGRRVGKIFAVLEENTYLVEIEGYERKPKLKARFNEKYRVGDLVKLEPVGFNNQLEIAGRTGARRYTEKLLDEQLKELLSGTSYNASQISYDDSIVDYEAGESPAQVVQLAVDYLFTRYVALKERVDNIAASSGSGDPVLWFNGTNSYAAFETAITPDEIRMTADFSAITDTQYFLGTQTSTGIRYNGDAGEFLVFFDGKSDRVSWTKTSGFVEFKVKQNGSDWDVYVDDVLLGSCEGIGGADPIKYVGKRADGHHANITIKSLSFYSSGSLTNNYAINEGYGGVLSDSTGSNPCINHGAIWGVAPV